MATRQVDPDKPRVNVLPATVVKQPWGFEYACCGGDWSRGHVGRCGS